MTGVPWSTTTGGAVAAVPSAAPAGAVASAQPADLVAVAGRPAAASAPAGQLVTIPADRTASATTSADRLAAAAARRPASAVDLAAAHAANEGVTDYLSVVDRSTGAVLAETANAGQQVASESIMKLFLATYYLLLYGGYTHTPADVRSRLSYMLRYSDDATASALFTSSAIPTVAARYGLSATTNATDRPGHWGAARSPRTT